MKPITRKRIKESVLFSLIVALIMLQIATLLTTPQPETREFTRVVAYYVIRDSATGRYINWSTELNELIDWVHDNPDLDVFITPVWEWKVKE